MKQKKIFLLAIIVALISCKKNDDSFQIEGQYKSNTNGIVTPVMMYTKQGQVTSSTTIQDFLQRKGVSSAFIFNSSSTSITANMLTLTITQNNMATILTSFSSSPMQGEIVNQTSSELVIAQMDSVQSLIPNGSSNIASRCDTLSMAIKNINPAKKYYPLPSSSGYNGYYKFRPMFPVEIKNRQLILPLMTSLVSASSGNSYCLNSVRDEWNTFNSNIIGQLQTGDTIIYQIKEVQLLKQ
jgi:hypothetical protein